MRKCTKMPSSANTFLGSQRRRAISRIHAPTYVFERTLSNQGNDAFLCYQGTLEANTS